LTFTSGHFEIRKWPKNYQNLLRTFIETFTPNLLTNQKVSKQTVKKILLEAHRHQWALDRNKCSDGKLRTYVKF
jgi:hypothetical protein